MFYFVFEGLFEGNFPSTSPQAALYLEGRFNGGFFALLVWGACIWRGYGGAYFQNFTVLKLKGDGDVKINSPLHVEINTRNVRYWELSIQPPKFGKF